MLSNQEAPKNKKDGFDSSKSLMKALGSVIIPLLVASAPLTNLLTPPALANVNNNLIEESFRQVEYNIVDQVTTNKAEQTYKQYAKLLGAASAKPVVFYVGGLNEKGKPTFDIGSGLEIKLPDGTVGYITAAHVIGEEHAKIIEPAESKLGDTLSAKKTIGNPYSRRGNETTVNERKVVIGIANLSQNISKDLVPGANAQKITLQNTTNILSPDAAVMRFSADIALVAKNPEELRKILKHLQTNSNLASASDVRNTTNVSEVQPINSLGLRFNKSNRDYDDIFDSTGIGHADHAVLLGKYFLLQMVGANTVGRSEPSVTGRSQFLAVGVNDSIEIEGYGGKVFRNPGEIAIGGNSGQGMIYKDPTSGKTLVLSHQGQANLEKNSIPEIINYLTKNPVFAKKIWKIILDQKIIELDKNIMNYLEHATPEDRRNYILKEIATAIKTSQITIYILSTLTQEDVQKALLNAQQFQQAPEIGNTQEQNDNGAVK